jgi:catalase
MTKDEIDPRFRRSGSNTQDILTWGKRGRPHARYLVVEKLAHFDREVIPSAGCTTPKASGAFGTFTVTHD